MAAQTMSPQRIGSRWLWFAGGLIAFIVATVIGVIAVGNFTADKYVANDDPRIFNWVIHPEGFHAPKLMELAKLQAWTLKPAVLRK